MDNNLQTIIQSHIKDKSMDDLKKLLASAENKEILHALYDLTPDEEVIAFRLLAKNDALEVFEHLEPQMQQRLIKSFTDEKTIEIMNELPPDDRVRLLDELPAMVAKKLINSLSQEEREATNILLGYQPETAGRIMTTEYISLRRKMTASEAFERIRIQAQEKETIYTLYVTDDAKKLEGVLTLKDLIIAEPSAIIEDIMAGAVIKASTDTDQEEVANTLHELDLLAIPVVDKEDRLVGIVTVDDAMDILEEEVTEDIFDQAGLADITDNESDRSEVLIRGNLWAIWKVRLPFLLATLALGMLSGLVIEGFEEILESIAMVAIFIPVIMGMGGNIGTQSSTVFARGVVLGHIQIKRFLKPFLKEIWVGFSIGVLIGLISGLVALVWLGLPMLGLAVGLAMVITMTVATMLGYLVPYVLIRLNVDQAAGSAPIITTLKDLVALIIYFVCVSVFMGNML